MEAVSYSHLVFRERSCAARPCEDGFDWKRDDIQVYRRRSGNEMRDVGRAGEAERGRLQERKRSLMRAKACKSLEALKMNDEEIPSLIENLKTYDSEEGYKLQYRDAKERLSDAIARLTEKGESVLDFCIICFKRKEHGAACLRSRF